MPETIQSEHQSLLGIGHINNDLSLCNDEISQNGAQDRRRQESFPRSLALSRVVLYFMAIHFLLAFCELVLVAPLIKLFERSLCISYYELHNPSIIIPGDEISEFRCKAPGVQTPLATIRGWKSMLDTIPGTEPSPYQGFLHTDWKFSISRRDTFRKVS